MPLSSLKRRKGAPKAVFSRVGSATDQSCGGVSRIKKLVEIAQGSTAAAQLLGAGLDLCGVHVDAIEAFNNMMSSTPDSQVQGVLKQVSTVVEEELTAADGRDIILALGAPLPDGVPAADGGAPKKFVQATERLLEGVKIGKKVLAKGSTRLQKAAKRIASKAKKYHDIDFNEDKMPFKDIWEQISRLDKDKVQELQRLVRQLARKRDIVRIGARRSIAVAATVTDPAKIASVVANLKLPPGTSKVVIETLEKSTQVKWLPKVGKGLRVRTRVYDQVLNAGGKRFFCEVKRWKKFPPNPEALESALDQMRRDVVRALTDNPEELGISLKNLRWILPNIIKGSSETIIARFQGAVDNQVKRALTRAFTDSGLTGKKLTDAVDKGMLDAKNAMKEIFVFLE